MSRYIWKPMGAQHSAYITVDRLGAPRCAGGIRATARDLARLGQVVADGGACEGGQIISAAWIDDIVQNGSAGAWNAGVFAPYFPGRKTHYRNKWKRILARRVCYSRSAFTGNTFCRPPKPGRDRDDVIPGRSSRRRADFARR
jgi:CubicO group peptidase (beta-lactamase class C family)